MAKDITKIFDDLECKRESELGISFGYDSYENYMSKDQWKLFKATMKQDYPEIFKQFGGDKGKEIKAGKYPPKMASCGSSSRMIYELARKDKSFIFEKIFPTKVGGSANLDGFFRLNGRAYFVEAKKHEIYKPHTIDKSAKKAYSEVYNYLVKKGLLGKHDNHYYRTDGHIIEFFDYKQIVCHFLAIANACLERTLYGTPITFLYLIYNPQSLGNTSLNSRYETVLKECGDISYFKRLFTELLFFQFNCNKNGYDLVTKEDLKTISDSFIFEFVDQDTFRKYINQ